ncbi:MAG: YbjQ family protein [Pseudomonadota bacterium]
MEGLIQLGIIVLLLLLGYSFGRLNEKRHYKSIRESEAELRGTLVINERFPPPQWHRHEQQLVMGNVVISVDYFKTFIAGLRNLVGGHITAYESLLDRARREAVIRMQRDAEARGAEAILNMRFVTCQVSGNAGQGIGSIEVLAYGTAMVPASAA